MPDVTANYGTPFDCIAFFGIFIHYYWPFMSELLYPHQTFTGCISNQYTHFDILTWQMQLQIMEDSLLV